MNNKKGFTLIEILTVIIILGLITAVAIFAISGLIGDKEVEVSDTFKEIIYSANNLFIIENIDDYPIRNGNTYCIEIQTLLDKQYLSEPLIDPTTQKELSTDLFVETKVVDSLFQFNLKETCTVYNLYNEDILNGGIVALGEGMIPVIIENDGTIKIADLTEEWYKYEDSIWANAVTVIDSEAHYRTDLPGTVIDMEHIFQIYVYIPRYKYEVFYTDDETHTVNVEFEPKSSITGRDISLNTNPSTLHGTGTMITHPAFYYEENGSTVELDGVWIGKFELATDNKIIPNANPIKSLEFVEHYKNILTLNNTNGISNASDIHLIKDSEWGGALYLSQSIYGICNSLVSCENVVFPNNYRINSSVTVVTGCGGVGETIDAECPLENRWNFAAGKLASSTHNISGIYDLAGGSYEVTMGNMVSQTGEFIHSMGQLDEHPHTKYYDAYEYGTTYMDAAAYSRAKLGTAINEMAPQNGETWYGDLGHFPSGAFSWNVRGGDSPFFFTGHASFSNPYISTRTAMWVY